MFMDKQGGDDLDDDFVIDDTVAVSGDEGQSESTFDAESSATSSQSESKDGNDKEVERRNAQLLKKRKMRQKQKERKKRKLVENIEEVEAPSKANRPPDILAEYLSSLQVKTFSKMSAIELADVHIPDVSIADTTSWTESRSLDQLVNFIIKVLPTLRTRLSQKSKSNGAPTLIFVAGAALRVVDVTRVLKDKKLRGDKGGEIAKLFARHFKLEDHVKYLRRTRIAAAVGTPGRLGKLLTETDALSLSALTHIMIDTTFHDTKKRSLFDMAETRDELFRAVLGCPSVLQAIRQGKVQVVLF